MPRNYTLRIRLNIQELERLKAVAQTRQVSMSEVIRDYIKRLPKKKSRLNEGGCQEKAGKYDFSDS